MLSTPIIKTAYLSVAAVLAVSAVLFLVLASL